MADRSTLDGSGDCLPLYASVFVAKLTSVSTVGGFQTYAWTEQRLDPSSAAFIDLENGRAGTASISPAYEINNRKVNTFPTLVWMRLRGWVSNQLVYEFLADTLSVTGETVTLTDDAVTFTGTSSVTYATGTTNTYASGSNLVYAGPTETTTASTTNTISNNVAYTITGSGGVGTSTSFVVTVVNVDMHLSTNVLLPAGTTIGGNPVPSYGTPTVGRVPYVVSTGPTVFGDSVIRATATLVGIGRTPTNVSLEVPNDAWYGANLFIGNNTPATPAWGMAVSPSPTPVAFTLAYLIGGNATSLVLSDTIKRASLDNTGHDLELWLDGVKIAGASGVVASTLTGTVAIVNGGSGQATAVAAKDALTVKGADIPSAATTDLSAATGEYVHVTGVVTITALGTAAAGVERVVEFTGILTLTHDATTLILPGGANITTAAGDVATFRSEGSGNWRCTNYSPASGGGIGSVTSVSVVTANGVSGTVATATTTPAITLTLGDITPTSVAISAPTATSYALSATKTTATTAAVVSLASFTMQSSGTAADGFGLSVLYVLEDAAGGTVGVAELDVSLPTAAHATFKGRAIFSVSDAGGARTIWTGEASGAAPMIGFLGANAAVRQTGDAGTALVTNGLMSGTPTFAAANLTGTVGVPPGGRLTLTTATPVTTTDVTSTTVYYTPWLNDRIELWTGSYWQPVTFTEQSCALGTLTSATLYYVYGYLSAGVLALDAPSATAPTVQNGRYCKGGDATRLLLGAFVTTSTTQTKDALANRNLANMYNRVPREAESTDSTTRTSTSTTLAQVGSVQIGYVTLGDQWVRTQGAGHATGGAGGVVCLVAVGSATNTAVSGGVYGFAQASSATACLPSVAECPAVGLTTRYLIFKSQTAGVSVNVDGAGIIGPNTVLRATIWQ